ncbi:MAG: 16S rRNA (adenine(1518)-N(6)/adenine(1519)-N(6))-dimethyltransferase RsmA [Desulfuromonadales bacterium]|nr:16S rRNA (adenine(1518)-N(6)/adenine(1519)-N(6))-dimethyltransferase RsmA [Desulfuromonadales bacterium]
MPSHRPRKRFGQNFLHDQNVLERIVAAAEITDQDHLLEIGPGPGALTKRLLATDAPLLAIEIDRDLGVALQQQESEKFKVVIGDVLKIDLAPLLTDPPYKLIANLPYNISSQILFKVLDHRQLFDRLVLMFQKEVGERLLAEPSSKEYGIISVLMQTWYSIRRVTKVPPGAFRPAPKVDSVVLCLDPLQTPRVELRDDGLYRRLVRGAFAQRRKTLRNSLLGSGWSPESLDAALMRAEIDPGRRGETLSIEEFACLANILATEGDV